MADLLHSLILLPYPAQALVAVMAIAGLWFGSDKVIWGVKRIARKFGISELIIGLTIVSIGSSLPEIFVNISAGLRGVDDIGVGNIVGSCFVQISFILALCVLVGGPMSSKQEKLKRDGTMVVGSIVLLFLLGMDGSIGTGEALLLVLTYMSYIYYLLIANRKKWSVTKSVSPMTLNILAFSFGVALVWISAEALLTVGIHAGREFGLNEGLIGLLSGIGTSIPELSISMMALLRKSNGISLGNLLGSNITDPLFSLGIGAVLAGGYQVSDFLLWQAIPMWFVASGSSMLMLWFFGKIDRKFALLLITFYLGSFVLFLS